MKETSVSREAAGEKESTSLLGEGEALGACGRKLIRRALDGRLSMIVEPKDHAASPCTRCRRNCPGEASATIAAE